MHECRLGLTDKPDFAKEESQFETQSLELEPSASTGFTKKLFNLNRLTAQIQTLG
jgi:hypothetical protein